MAITKNDLEKWYRYAKVRSSKKYNMIMNYKDAAAEANLTISQYSDTIKRYSLIKDKILKEYNSIENFMEKMENEN